MAKSLAFLGFFLAICFLTSDASPPPLKTGFYHKTCPSAESIVRSVVNKAYIQDSGIAAALIRLHFHDCFVRGCDASILLDSTPHQKAEKESMGNKGVQGFEIIDEAKTLIESNCPNTVSCADIVAFAARDSVYRAGGNYYAVPAGRRDGKNSSADDVLRNLPGEYFDAAQLKLNFAAKGLSLDDMVTLSGAHSIGDSHCSSFDKRLYSFNGTREQDPSLDRAYAKLLRDQCPLASASKGGVDPVVRFDPTTPLRLDNNYYKNLEAKRGLLFSDQTLWDSDASRSMVKSNANHQSRWADKFAKAMVRMGYVEVLTGKRGEIRKNCRVVNK